MDVYRNIVKDIKDMFIAEGNTKAAKKTKAIMDRYIELMLDGLFHRFKFQDRNGLMMDVKIYSMAYISYNMGRQVTFSRLHPYHLFKISIKWDILRKNKFTCKPMRNLYNKYRKDVLDTEQIHDILKNYETTVVQRNSR